MTLDRTPDYPVVLEWKHLVGEGYWQCRGYMHNGDYPAVSHQALATEDVYSREAWRSEVEDCVRAVCRAKHHVRVVNTRGS